MGRPKGSTNENMGKRPIYYYENDIVDNRTGQITAFTVAHVCRVLGIPSPLIMRHTPEQANGICFYIDEHYRELKQFGVIRDPKEEDE